MARATTWSMGRASRGVFRGASFSSALAALLFLVYACTIFTLPQVRHARYCCEQSSVAAAVSNIMYQAPLGSLYSEVLDFFVDHIDEPLEQTLHEVRTSDLGQPASPLGELYLTTRDGNGVGYPLLATAAFRLFGLHAWALIFAMLMLMSLSAVAFLWRFRSAVFSGVVILYFTSLTVMLFTPLVWDPSYAVNVTVGGIRYFSLVSVLPTFHILLTLLDSRTMEAGDRARNAALLGAQTAILVLVILVRGSALPLIGAFALVWVVLVWRRRHDRDALRALLSNAAVIGITSFGLLLVIAAAVPRNYLTEGRFGTVIWMRVTDSLGVNPAFPFPGINEILMAGQTTPKASSGTPDGNAECILFDYMVKHKYSD